MFNLGSALSLPPKTAKACLRMPLTPERIPTFIIPPKVQIRSPRARHRDTEYTQLLSPDHCDSPQRRGGLNSPSFALSARSPRFPRLSPAPVARRGHASSQDSEDRTDLSTRAALGLEHVKKIATPYGFRTLAESPHVRRRESLFHGATTSNVNQPPASPGTVSGCSTLDEHEAFSRSPAARQPSTESRAKRSPNPKAILKSTKTSIQMLLRKPREALKTPQRQKQPSSSCS
ncbi:hypothetical protein ACEWY4_024281 [Coilia grayii]|uniref:Uncharacterized protein n=1 Tax=Coilia grayii TaxID=363190 RepID=A0ABD1IZZ1_9TELE